jgi:hypothetical protein
MRYITLGNGNKMSLKGYCKAWKQAKRLSSDTVFTHGLDGWWEVDRNEILRQFNDGLHARINQHIPWYNNGKKWVNQWQIDTLRAARELNTPRLVIHWLPHWLKNRFEHRLHWAKCD